MIKCKTRILVLYILRPGGKSKHYVVQGYAHLIIDVVTSFFVPRTKLRATTLST